MDDYTLIRNPYGELIALEIGGFRFQIIDTSRYLSPDVQIRIRDLLEDNVYREHPLTLEEMKPVIRERLSDTFGTLSAVTDEDIERVSWFAGGRTTQFYHGVF